VRKKIRAIQYGVGPIGASLVRLMREKQAIEVIGAIDTDPAKVGRDLGEVAGASDAPWGIEITGDSDILSEAADIVVHSTSSHLPAVVDQLSSCLAAESCVVSTCEELVYPYRKYPDLAKRLDAEAKSWGVALVGTGVNPGFVMDKLVLTLGAAAQRVDAVRVTRIVDASKRRLPLQRKVDAGGVQGPGCRRRHQASRAAGIDCHGGRWLWV
jgi:2,4-diaminopentanoate dehydrogenase